MLSVTATILISWAVLTSIVTAAPAPAVSSANSDPATVYFTPYKVVGCRMSENPKDTSKPNSYTLTSSSGCITPPYAFGSYVESANSLAASGPCALTIYSGAGCTGSTSPGVITSYSQCQTGAAAAGKSVRMACGP